MKTYPNRYVVKSVPGTNKGWYVFDTKTKMPKNINEAAILVYKADADWAAAGLNNGSIKLI